MIRKREKYNMLEIADILKKYEDEGYLKGEDLATKLAKTNKFNDPDKTAIADPYRSVTYSELWSEIEACTRRLAGMGIRKGSNVLLQMPNTIEYVVTLFALFRLDAPPVLMLTPHREREIIAVGQLTEAEAYISTVDYMGFDYSEMIKGITDQLPSLKTIIIQGLEEDNSDDRIKWYNWADRTKETEPELYTDCRGTALYLLSGGTTGVPKVIPKIHECYCYNADVCAERCGFDKDTVYMCVLPASHDLGLANPGILGALFSGGTAVLCETSSFDEAFDMIEEYGVTSTTLVPAVIKVWAENIDWYDADLSSLRHIMFGAARIDLPDIKKIISKLGVRVQQAYGLGEGLTCCTKLTDSEEVVFGTQGSPVSEGDEVRILDENGNALPVGEAGELAEKGPYTFMGYYRNPERNKACFTEDGFFRTGDRAKLTEEGNIVILGRTVEQINRAGENVIPSEIEAFLMKHPDIKNASVFGIPDEKLGEKTAACIITDNDALDRTAICSFMLSIGAAAYKIPDVVVHCDAFPLKNVGKVDKAALKSSIMDQI